MADISYIIIPLIASLVSLSASLFFSKKLLRLSLLVLFIFASLRYNLGGDYPAYYYIFQNISQGTIPSLYYAEPLFLLLNYIISYLSLPFNVVLAVSNGVLLFSLYKLFSRLNHQYWFFLVSFYAFAFNGYWSHLIYTRQEIALGFVVLSSIALFERKTTKYLLLVFVASLFHNPAVIAFSFLFLKKRLKISTVLGAVILSVLSIYMIKMFLAHYNNHYSAYLNFESGGYLSISLVIDIILLAFFTVLVRRNIPSLFYNLFIIGKVFAVVKIIFPIMFRIELYFFPFNILGICYIYIYMVRQKFAKITMVMMLISLLYCILSMVKNISGKSDKYYWSGYKSVIFEENDLNEFQNRRDYDNYHLLK